MYSLQRNILPLGRFNNYIIAGNVTREFAIGEVGSPDDFYFVGTEPPEEAPFPMLSGNVLDSNGTLLFKLVKNVIVNNPYNCYKIVGDFIGYEIHDSEGTLILKVETKYQKIPQIDEEYFYTTIKANFYNKNKELVFRANSGEADEDIKGTTKMYMGIGGITYGYAPGELEFVTVVLKSGTVYEKVTGKFEGINFILDGKCLHNVLFLKCNILVATGDFIRIGADNGFVNSTFYFSGFADNVKYLIQKGKFYI